MKTYSAKPKDIDAKWYIVDATDMVLGRLASEVAKIIRGKHKAMFTPHMDCGDYVVVINADKIHLTGKKRQDKKYFWHTGYPGGIREINAEKILEGQHPSRVFTKAVQRMISRNPLGRQQMKKLRVFAGAEHGHEAQQPIPLDIAARNVKNKKRQSSE